MPGTDFPDLTRAKRIGVDIETFDPDLKKMGPGVRRTGYIAGVSLSVQDSNDNMTSNYYPIAHGTPDDPGGNFDTGHVLDYLRKSITSDRLEIVGTNLIYDLDFLAEAGVEVKGKLLDVQVAEPIIDENKRGFYDLENLSQLYLEKGKESDDLYKYLADKYGGKPTRTAQAGRIWMAPGHIAAPYAISDSENPLGIIKKQLKTIEDEGLTEVWELEQGLQPMLLAMKRRGVRIDVEAAQAASDRMVARVEELRIMLDKYDIIPTVASTVGEYCDLIDIPYSLTASTRQPSVTNPWMEKHSDNPVIAALAEVKRFEKNNGTFIQGLLSHVVGDRVHCQFNQLPSDTYGAVSGRLSSSRPNLQNIPARDMEMFLLIRGLFIPDEGELWGRADYSQIEYRLLVEYAVKKFGTQHNAMAMMNRFIEHPDTDMHKAVGELCGISRGDGKTINFGMVYGLGVKALMASLGYPKEVCEEIIEKYHDMMPFAKKLYRNVQNKAGATGFIRTIGGRQRRFNRWEPDIPWELQRKPSNPVFAEFMRMKDDGAWVRNMNKRPKPFEWKQAKEEYPKTKLKRAHVHTALNALLQGGGADVMKRGMVDLWQSGVCDVLGVPMLTVHDELNWSVPQTAAGREAFAESNRILEAVYSDRLKIPLLVESGMGSNWAACK